MTVSIWGCFVYLANTIQTFLAAIILLLLAFILYRLCLHPLSRIPGPRLAAISTCWYAYHVRNGRMLELGKTLHKKYGPVVRVAPNDVWFDSKDAFKLIYSPTNGFEKSDFYLATALLKPKIDSLFRLLPFPDTLDLLAERDMKRYRLQRRLIGPVYHTNNVKKYEKAVDDVLERVVEQIRTLEGAEVDLKEWMHIITVECLGAVSLSWSPGYLKDKSDGASGKHGYLGWRRKSVFGLFPAAVVAESLPGRLSKSIGRAFGVFWGVTYHTPKEGFNPFFPAVQKKVSQRVRGALRGKPQNDNRKDIMADLIQLHKDRPEFTEPYLRRMAITNFGAGHETMTSALISAISMIGSHAEVQRRVVEEVRKTELFSGDDTADYSYTQASIKEAQRLYPVIGMSLPRKVPAEGMRLDGFYFPPDTVVGCNPASLHRNKDIFGHDAEDFRPGRWLSDNDVKTMDRFNLIWGGGSRTCPGRYLADMLVSKIVPALVKEFELEIVMPPEEDVCYYFMAMLTGVKVRFHPRKDRS